jgi:hypothetical protein
MKFLHRTLYKDSKKNEIRATLQLFYYVDENDLHVLYCPALDLTGYGDDLDKAKASFDIVLEGYLRYTVNKGTLFEDLKKHGWKVKEKNKKASSPTVQDLLQRNKDFSALINNKSIQTFDKSVEIPVM